MDFLIVKYWLLTFVGIILFLGGLTYFILQQNFTDKFQLDQMNRQGHRSSAGNRRKNARNANKRKQQQQQQQQQQQTINNSDITEEEEQKRILPKKTTENDEKDYSGQQTDEEQEEKEKFQDTNQTKQTISPPTHVEDEQEPTIPIKQPNKTKTINKPTPSVPLSKVESIVPSKPQASVAPVKQIPLMEVPINNFKSSQNHQDNYPKSNGHVSSSQNIYTYSAFNPLPPRFQQQRQQQQQKEAAYTAQKYRRRRGGRQSKRSSFPPDSAARSNDFVPASLRQQDINHNQTEPLVNFTQQQQESSINNGYSSESDILTDTPSTGGNNSISPLLSTSPGSQSSLQRLDLVRSVTTSHTLLDELISIFDTTSFSSDELELILNKIATKHILDRNDFQRLISSSKNDKTLERILEETYRSQAKIFAIELQTEKNRVLELTKSNADMENIIRQLQQQQHQPTNIIQYQQMILHFQMQIRRLGDENLRLQQQLHAYSPLPATLVDLKQQQHVLNEQIRQMTIRNSALESGVADSERASKHAAEIYKKADAQKQERIEQMIADINKYKKLDKELTNLRQKHVELEKNLNSKITEITNQRDELQKQCDQLKEQIQQYEKLLQNPTNQIAQELNNLKIENDQLRQSNWKNMEQLNKLLNENQDTKSS